MIVVQYDTTEIDALRAWAEDPAHYYDPSAPNAVIPGDDPHHRLIVLTVKVVFAITRMPPGELSRTVSFSSADGRDDPPRIICEVIARHLGFTGDPASWGLLEDDSPVAKLVSVRGFWQDYRPE